VLVFAADLQQVEEVCCCAVDADCVLVGCWGWGGEVGYAEILGALWGMLDLFGGLVGCLLEAYRDIFFHLNATHDGECM